MTQARDDVKTMNDQTNAARELADLRQETVRLRATMATLAASQEMFRNLFAAAPEGILVADIATMQFRFANPAICRMLGYSQEELLALGVADIHPPTNLAQVRQEFAAQARGEKTLAAGLPVLRKDGTVFYADVNTAVASLDGVPCNIGFFEDITRRHAMELDLRESEARFRNLADLLPAIVFESDLEGKLLFASRYAFEVLDYSKEDMARGINGVDFVVPEDRPRMRENMHLMLTGKPSPGNEYTALRRNGSRYPVMVYSNPVIRDQTPVGFRGVIVDITDRKRMEEELARRQKLESLGVLAGGIAHDFNNLLVGILGNIGLARAEVEPCGAAQNFLRDAEQAVGRARGLTQQLLTFAKGGAPITALANVGAVAQEAARFATRGSKVTCAYAIPPDLWPAEIDSDQIAQAINNLVINAVQAMPQGGTIEVRCANLRVEPGETTAPVPPGDYVCLTFADQGAGVPAADREKIFDPYFTTKEKGNGLGLTSVYSIVRRHGGNITLKSAPDQGAAFTLYLPANPDGLPAQPTEEHVVKHGSGRILIMDDDAMVRKVAAAMLGRLGYDVHAVENGPETLAAYRQASAAGAPFAAVILDLTIPGGQGGAEVLAELRQLDPNVRAIVSSGYCNDPVMANFEQHGFKGVAPKPYQMTSMSQTLEQVLGAKPLQKKQHDQ